MRAEEGPLDLNALARDASGGGQDASDFPQIPAVDPEVGPGSVDGISSVSYRHPVTGEDLFDKMSPDARERIEQVLKSLHDTANQDPQSAPEIYGDRDGAFARSLQRIKDGLDLPEHASVVYPGSSTHTDVATVFGVGDVTHVDPNDMAMKRMATEGYRTVPGNMQDYRPDTPFDVLVAFNLTDHVSRDTLNALVRPGGYIIANAWHNMANSIADLGVIPVGVLPDYDQGDHQFSLDPEAVQAMSGVHYWDPSRGNTLLNSPVSEESEAFPDHPSALFVFQMPEGGLPASNIDNSK